MQYHVAENGVQSGPFPEEQIREMYTQGRLTANALCWRDGWDQWKSCAEVFGRHPVPPPALPVNAPNLPPESGQSLRQIAVYQRRLIYCILLQSISGLVGRIAADRGSAAVALVFGIATLGLFVYGLIYGYRLAVSLGFSGILHVIGLLIPCLSLLVLLVLVSRATRALKRAGVKVGLFGVPPEELRRIGAV